MPSVNVEKLEERWTPTTVQTAFILRASDPRSSTISVDLPLLNLGWTFALSLTAEHSQVHENPKKKQIKRNGNWIPVAFSFRRHDGTVRWNNTSLHAQLELAVEQPQVQCTPSSVPAGECIPPDTVGSNAMPLALATFKVVLANTPSFELPLTTPCALSSLHPHKISLTLTISDCPLANGLFEACSGTAYQTQVQAQFAKLRGDRFLSRSLTTGKPFDIKFLANSTRSSGNTVEPLPTYTSLSVLEGHINPSSSILGEGWTNALATLDNTDAIREISCPEDYQYELDSDFEEVDEDESPPDGSGSERDLAAPEARTGQQSERGTERSSSSLSSFEPVDQPEELIKNMNEPPSGYERTIWVKFAAHKTWHAFLWYCYTGELEFCKLKSEVEPGGRHLHAIPVEGGQPACSPKSMYRLADLVGNKDLKAKALAAIKERMTEANVMDETLSVFTSKHPEVREVQLDILTKHSRSPKVKEAFLRAMEKYSNMPHAKPVLSAFYDKLVTPKSSTSTHWS